MADNNSDQEKTEQPSPKRLLDARSKGRIPRSRELNITLSTLSGGILLIFSAAEISHSITRAFEHSYRITGRNMLTNHHLLNVVESAFSEVLGSLTFLFIMLIILVIIGSAMIGGWSFSLRALSVKFSKLNPLTGLKRMFGANGLIELIKSVLKVALIASIAYACFWANRQDFLSLAGQHQDRAIVQSFSLVLGSYLYIACGLILIIAIDVPYQLWNHKRQLKMSLRELKDEFKETEGNPQSKARAKNLQREIAQRKMLADVPQADVVIVNPVHFSVALKYDYDHDAAPVLVAKGADHMAIKIREIAARNRVPVFTAPLLARAVYHTTALANEVSPELYVAVAKVLAYVFQLKHARPGRYPDPPTDLSIPGKFTMY